MHDGISPPKAFMVDYIEPNYASASSPQSNGKDATMIEQLVKNYRIVSELGSGGMGQVYKAVHESNRRVPRQFDSF